MFRQIINIIFVNIVNSFLTRVYFHSFSRSSSKVCVLCPSNLTNVTLENIRSSTKWKYQDWNYFQIEIILCQITERKNFSIWFLSISEDYRWVSLVVFEIYLSLFTSMINVHHMQLDQIILFYKTNIFENLTKTRSKECSMRLLNLSSNIYFNLSFILKLNRIKFQSFILMLTNLKC